MTLSNNRRTANYEPSIHPTITPQQTMSHECPCAAIGQGLTQPPQYLSLYMYSAPISSSTIDGFCLIYTGASLAQIKRGWVLNPQNWQIALIYYCQLYCFNLLLPTVFIFFKSGKMFFHENILFQLSKSGPH